MAWNKSKKKKKKAQNRPISYWKIPLKKSVENQSYFFSQKEWYFYVVQITVTELWKCTLRDLSLHTITKTTNMRWFFPGHLGGNYRLFKRRPSLLRQQRSQIPSRRTSGTTTGPTTAKRPENHISNHLGRQQKAPAGKWGQKEAQEAS